MKLQKSLVIPLVLIFGTLIILLSTIQQSTTFAQTTDDPITTKSVNGVSMRVVFHFNAGVEEITTLEVFKLIEGYDKTTPPKFQLVGIVDGNKPLLHKAVHERFHQPATTTQYSDFDIEIYLTDKYSLNVLNRFNDCNIKDFFIDTFYDKNKTWQGDLKFAWLETYEFECLGAHPLHPGGTKATGEITNKPEEKEPLTWEDLYP